MAENINNGSMSAQEAAAMALVQSQQSLEVFDPDKAYGFEEADSADVVIPRIKVINALSPERLDGEAEEGWIINSLTKERVEELHFVPIKQYYSCIKWNPERDEDPRMFCRSADGRVGITADGATLLCKQCGCDKFDNTKQGKAAQPTCTRYLNFLGFFVENPALVILSFARTNYNEGRKMLSISKSMRSAIWAYSYVVSSRQVTKDRNKWYIMVPQMSGKTDEATQRLAFELFKSVNVSDIKADYDDSGAAAAPASNAEMAEEI